MEFGIWWNSTAFERKFSCLSLPFSFCSSALSRCREQLFSSFSNGKGGIILRIDNAPKISDFSLFFSIFFED